MIAAAAVLVQPSRSEGFGSSVLDALALGVGKELYDLGGHGTASGRDLLWDGVGALVGALIGLGLDWALEDAPPADHPRVELWDPGAAPS